MTGNKPIDIIMFWANQYKEGLATKSELKDRIRSNLISTELKAEAKMLDRRLKDISK